MQARSKLSDQAGDEDGVTFHDEVDDSDIDDTWSEKDKSERQYDSEDDRSSMSAMENLDSDTDEVSSEDVNDENADIFVSHHKMPTLGNVAVSCLCLI